MAAAAPGRQGRHRIRPLWSHLRDGLWVILLLGGPLAVGGGVAAWNGFQHLHQAKHGTMQVSECTGPRGLITCRGSFESDDGTVIRERISGQVRNVPNNRQYTGWIDSAGGNRMHQYPPGLRMVLGLVVILIGVGLPTWSPIGQWRADVRRVRRARARDRRQVRADLLSGGQVLRRGRTQV